MESGFRQLGIFRVIALVQTHLVEMHGLPGMWPSHGLYYNLQTPQNTQKSDDFKHSGTDRHIRHFPTRTSKQPAFKRVSWAFREARYHQNPPTFKQCGPFHTKRCKIADNAKVKSRWRTHVDRASRGRKQNTTAHGKVIDGGRCYRGAIFAGR